MDFTQIAFVVGMVFGALMITSVCAVYFRRGTFGMGGGVLSVLGVLLIGMSVWSTASFELSPQGLNVEVQRLRERVDQVQARAEEISGEVVEVKTAARTISHELADVALVARTGNQGVLRLTEALRERQALDPAAVREIEEHQFQIPEIDVDRIRALPDAVERRGGPPPGDG